jgi:hypothetical protein
MELYECKEISEYNYSEIRGLGAGQCLPSLTRLRLELIC